SSGGNWRTTTVVAGSSVSTLQVSACWPPQRRSTPRTVAAGPASRRTSSSAPAEGDPPDDVIPETYGAAEDLRGAGTWKRSMRLSVAEEESATSLIGSGHVVHPEEPQGGPGGRRLQLRRPARSGVPPGDQGARPRKIRPRLPAPPSRLSVPLRAHPREAGGGVRGPARQRANEARRGDRRAEGMGRRARPAR